MENVYFALTEAFNREGPTVALASGQAVVFYRIAIMSKDGDWVIRETSDACVRVLDELERHGSREADLRNRSVRDALCVRERDEPLPLRWHKR